MCCYHACTRRITEGGPPNRKKVIRKGGVKLQKENNEEVDTIKINKIDSPPCEFLIFEISIKNH